MQNSRKWTERNHTIYRRSGLWSCVWQPRVETLRRPYYMFFGRDVVLPRDNLIKMWRETKIIWRLEVALWKTRGYKQGEIEMIWCFSDRDTETQRDRKTERKKERERFRDREKERGRNREKGRERQRRRRRRRRRRGAVFPKLWVFDLVSVCPEYRSEKSQS